MIPEGHPELLLLPVLHGKLLLQLSHRSPTHPDKNENNMTIWTGPHSTELVLATDFLSRYSRSILFSVSMSLFKLDLHRNRQTQLAPGNQEYTNKRPLPVSLLELLPTAYLATSETLQRSYLREQEALPSLRSNHQHLNSIAFWTRSVSIWNTSASQVLNM